MAHALCAFCNHSFSDTVDECPRCGFLLEPVTDRERTVQGAGIFGDLGNIGQTVYLGSRSSSLGAEMNEASQRCANCSHWEHPTAHGGTIGRCHSQHMGTVRHHQCDRWHLRRAVSDEDQAESVDDEVPPPRANQYSIRNFLSQYDFDSGDFTIVVNRVAPRTWNGVSIVGALGTFSRAIDLSDLERHFGGGSYSVNVYERTAQRHEAALVFHIAGAPIPIVDEQRQPSPPMFLGRFANDEYATGYHSSVRGQRHNVSAPSGGDTYFNTEMNILRMFVGERWVALGNDELQYMLDQDRGLDIRHTIDAVSTRDIRPVPQVRREPPKPQPKKTRAERIVEQMKSPVKPYQDIVLRTEKPVKIVDCVDEPDDIDL